MRIFKMWQLFIQPSAVFTQPITVHGIKNGIIGGLDFLSSNSSIKFAKPNTISLSMPKGISKVPFLPTPQEGSKQAVIACQPQKKLQLLLMNISIRFRKKHMLFGVYANSFPLRFHTPSLIPLPMQGSIQVVLSLHRYLFLTN